VVYELGPRPEGKRLEGSEDPEEAA
jgi:hypothetical protein